MPLYYTEWNAGHFDTSYAAAAVTQIFAYNESLVEGYSYWCISDIFEELGLHGLPFNNEFGLVTVYGIRKPAYPDREQLAELEEASKLVFEEISVPDGESVVLSCHAEAESVTIYRLRR